MAKVICPNCGSEVVLPEHSEMCMGMSISQESEGTYVLPMISGTNKKVDTIHSVDIPNINSTENKGETKMENITGENKMGMDAATLEAMKRVMGEDAYASLMAKLESDPIMQNIEEHGDLECGVDFHRWVLKQMVEYEFGWHEGWTRTFNDRVSFMDQFTDYMNKLKKIVHLQKNGKTRAAAEELQFITKGDVVSLCRTYLVLLKEQCRKMKTSKCKGIPYVKFERKEFFDPQHTNHWAPKDFMIFIEDLERTVYKPIENATDRIANSVDFKDLEYALRRITELPFFINVTAKTHDRNFTNNFKGYGAYFGLKDSIRFFGVRCTSYETDERLDRDASLKYLEELKDKTVRDGENYKLLALLEQSWKDSNFNRQAYIDAVDAKHSK